MSDEIAIKFPVYTMTDKNQKFPDKGIYYVIAGNGIFLHKENFVGSALVRVNQIPNLPYLDTQINLRLPKIPGRIIAQAHYFFWKVFQEHRSECGVILFYSREKREYLLWCPKQQVSYGSITYDRNDLASVVAGEAQGMSGFHQVGTIHSHCDFNAFHSGTDTADESDFDGVHITLGNCNKTPAFSMCASVAINNNRIEMEPEYTTDDLVRVVNESESKWMKLERQNYFEVVLSPEEQEALEADKHNIDETWLPKVEKHVWNNKSSWWTISSSKKNERGSDWGNFYS